MTLPVMFYCAGFGRRMGALTASRPKPLIEVAGRTLLDHALAQTGGVPSGPRAGNVHWCADAMGAALRDRDIAVSHETPDILETGGGLRAALPLLGNGPVATLNTDAVWTGPRALPRLLSGWAPGGMGALLLLVPSDRAEGHGGAGDFDMAPDGRLRRGTAFVYTGAQILRTDGLAGIPGPAFSTNVMWDRMMAEDRLFGIVHTGRWCDVGRPEGIASAEAIVEAEGVAG